jgi:hemerythrin-like domain-containing protein
MSKTIDRLRTDHKRLQAVLDTVSEVCKDLQSDDFESHSDHLFCLIDYLLGYPDEVHHPTEDLVFDELLTLDLEPGQLEKVTRNRSQHATLKSATSELMDLVEAYDVDVEQLLQRLNEFVALQRKHMKFEEQEIFPLALAHIRPASWKKLDQQYSESNDPLFDEADSRYATLFRYLVPGEQQTARMTEPLMRYLSAASRDS